MEGLINLAAFRKKNRITQQQVADFIGTSKVFVSSIEKGSCRLPDQKLNHLYFDSGWDPSDLNPHFQRVLKSWIEYNKENGINKKVAPLDDPIDPFNLAENAMYCLFYGYIGIDDEIANAITRVMPGISREWLLTGKGEMFSSCSIKDEERIAALEERVRKLEATVNRLKDVFKME